MVTDVQTIWLYHHLAPPSSRWLKMNDMTITHHQSPGVTICVTLSLIMALHYLQCPPTVPNTPTLPSPRKIPKITPSPPKCGSNTPKHLSFTIIISTTTATVREHPTSHFVIIKGVSAKTAPPQNFEKLKIQNVKSWEAEISPICFSD